MTEELYFDVQQKTDKQHILDNPDTYIGSVEMIDTNMYVFDDDKIVDKHISYIPGLYKLFDEGIVNCSDHVCRMQQKINDKVDNSLPVSYIDIAIQDDGTIIMINDGNGMDVVQHPEYKTWVPELIFAHLRTSTNYNKDEKKIVGGKNGFGFKLVLIWSTEASVETVDHIRGLKYVQEYKQNLDVICEPKITKCKTKPYTKITFKPDYARLGLSGLSPDMISLLKKRVYDISAITNKTIKVKYNSTIIPIKNFEQYINMYIGDKTNAIRVYEQTDPRWEYAVALSPTNEFIQVSFVNAIHTSKGGKHVEYILNQIIRKIIDYIEQKKKVKVQPSLIKEQLMLFIRCDIENPSFDSQTKDYMNTPVAKFGSKCEVSDKFIEKVATKMGVMETAIDINKIKDKKEAKKSDGSKTRSIKGIPKLEDANWAGTAKSSETMLVICEGDSAKAAVISALSSEDRDRIGVFPVKGKFLNVRGELQSKLNKNEELDCLKKIIGLETGKKYCKLEDVHKHLRYGKIVFMTDQDLDGYHIKGLGINIFHCEWKELTLINGFISFINTPIIKAIKSNKVLEFYNQGEYEEWKKESDKSGWEIKYYKGLGSSTKGEFKQYMNNPKLVSFTHTEHSDNAIDMVFNKKRADDRKAWIENVYNRNSFMDNNKQLVAYEEFINKELIHFSKYNCERSIPCVVDGLKPSLRKILYGSFKRRLTKEVKVAALAGYVTENASYHHGEASLQGAIIGMAQNFMGSNNINVLYPAGQFGTRLAGGSDAASPRYIFTYLEPITRYLFPEEDDAVLNYLEDDGTPVEPQYYCPIIPMILVNGTSGIGTGTSSEVLCYNPLDLIAYIKNKLTDESNDGMEFVPYYDGFTGETIKLSDTQYLFKGKYEVIDEDTIVITELPVGTWTIDYKEFLEKLENDKDEKGNKITPIVKSRKDNYTDSTIKFEVKLTSGKLKELEAINANHGCNGLEKAFKLFATKSTTNMNLFNAYDRLAKYDSVKEIIDEYYDARLECYQDRKEHIIDILEEQINKIENKVKYIKEILAGTIDLRKMKKQEIIDMLTDKGYDAQKESNDTENFNYLIKMPMDTVSDENVAKLLNEEKNKRAELELIKSTTEKQMWLNDLLNLEQQYILFKERKQSLLEPNDTKKDKDKNDKKVVNKKVVDKKVVKKITKTK